MRYGKDCFFNFKYRCFNSINLDNNNKFLGIMYSFIFDIGKTNIKGHVVDANGMSVWEKSNKNTVLINPPYCHFDVDEIWNWLCLTIKEAANEYKINVINISTHGACAVLLDDKNNLVLPVLDYENEEIETINNEYLQVKPSFEKTYSPNLSQGLNLGKQLYWQKKHFPEEFARVSTVLLYPQYWVYCLTGIKVTEKTSLGCHTDLWEQNKGFSNLVKTLNLDKAFPKLVETLGHVGEVKSEIKNNLGLDKECKVFAGVHDSNASFARYLYCNNGKPFSVISSGTWIVVMSNEAKLESIKESDDMLANIDVLGNALPCSRYMGGREFEIICELCNVSMDDTYSISDIQEIIDNASFAIPPFIAGSGPFRNHKRKGYINKKPSSGLALASLYTVLMIDYQLDSLDIEGDVLVGGISKKNPLLCNLLAQLRPANQILLSNDQTSTLKGAWCITRWGERATNNFCDFTISQPSELRGLENYKNNWRKISMEIANDE
jgi:sugar (pentulose or hexulose) kinase